MPTAATASLTVESLILDELRSLQKNVKDISERLAALEARLVPDADARLAEIETKLKPLFDNGQPGLLTTIVNRITELEHWRIYTIGSAAGVAGLVTWLFRTFWKA
jgi:hypothetical protein